MAVRAGDLRERVAFDHRIASDDGHGNERVDWCAPADALHRWAHFRHLRAGEAIQGARLQGQSTVVVTVRVSPETRAITAGQRMRDLATGMEYAVKSPPVLTDRRDMVEITVQSGVPA